MKYNPDKHHRHSIRLKDHDYSQAGMYFITTCTHGRKCILGNVVNGEMRLNEYGRVVEAEWLKTAKIRGNVELDVFVIMPNHIHGIVIITESPVGATSRSPLPPKGPSPKSIGAIISGFKSAVTKQVNGLRSTPGAPVWQRNYFEHVIRNENDLDETRKYILHNPLKWDLDPENPDIIKHRS